MKRLIASLQPTSYRLPTTDELFGDEDLEAGKTDLKPEKSDNVNFNLSYNRQFGKHAVYVEGTLIYRDTKDYIKRGLDAIGGMSYGYLRKPRAGKDQGIQRVGTLFVCEMVLIGRHVQ